MKLRQFDRFLLVIVVFAVSPLLAQAQTAPATGNSPDDAAQSASSAPSHLVYQRPTQKTKLHNYFFDAVGPYPIIGAAVAAGINQADNTPPEWNQGAEGYGKRFGSNFAIAGISTTTRYALAEAFREDTLYYPCECKGLFPRLGHAMISTFTARRGDEGRRVFSIPALVGPYAGTMTAVYAWYPGRYDARDGFRMGNYSLLAYVGGNVALEFLYGGPHSLLSRLHLGHGSAAQTRP